MLPAWLIVMGRGSSEMSILSWLSVSIKVLEWCMYYYTHINVGFCIVAYIP